MSHDAWVILLMSMSHSLVNANALAQYQMRSVLQCVAVCCSVLQYVAVCCTIAGCMHKWRLRCSRLNIKYVVCCSVLQCVAVCFRELQCVASLLTACTNDVCVVVCWIPNAQHGYRAHVWEHVHDAHKRCMCIRPRDFKALFNFEPFNRCFKICHRYEWV